MILELIDKAAVIAEIEKRLADNRKEIERVSHKNLEDYFEGYEDGLALLKQQFLDTLEVKEVDLEKEIDDYWCSLFCDYKMKRVAGHKFVPVPEYIDENFNQCENGKTQIAYVLEVDWKTDFNDEEWNGDDVIKFARYFYELGLKIKKGEMVKL